MEEDKHNLLMNLALNEAQKAYEADEVPVGALVIKNKDIIASAYNEVESKRSSLLHAEIIAIEKAAKVTGDWRLTDCEIYVTLEPCPMCAGAIRLARFKSVIFGAYDQRNGAFGSKINLSESSDLGPPIEVVGGILQDKCAEILRRFFEEKRRKN